MLDEFKLVAYQEHNKARLAHLASLGLPLHHRRVLEVGSGPGDHTGFYIERDCTVFAVDARAACLHALRERFPQVETRCADLNEPDALDDLTGFEVAHAYGVLYHLHNPATFLAAVSRATQLLILETCVSHGTDLSINLVDEPSEAFSQAASGRGCRPTRRWVFEEVAKHFPHVYQTRTQPAHEEFPVHWNVPSPHVLSRIVLVGSQDKLSEELLSPVLLETQTRYTDQKCLQNVR